MVKLLEISRLIYPAEELHPLLYNVNCVAGDEHYALPQEIKLAGKRGPLAAIARAAAPAQTTAKQVGFGWEASASDIVCRKVPPNANPADHAIVIDLKPGDPNVHLYRLLYVCGFSYKTKYTSLGLRLRELYKDREVPKGQKAEFQEHFSCPANGGIAREFLYVLGGVAPNPDDPRLVGTWRWGSVGRANGALLWDDAFTFLVDCLKQPM